MVEFSLSDNSYSVTRPKLRKWLSIEKIRAKLLKSAEKKDSKFIDYLLSYLSALLDIPTEDIEDNPWYEVIEGYHLSAVECSPKLDLSITMAGIEDTNAPDKLPDPWDYDERIWYSWCSLLAKNFSWSLEYISELDVDDGLALIQELELDEQFKKEWEWSLTEIAYKYDKSTKKSTLQPLPRPNWMKQATHFMSKEVQKPAVVVKISPSSIPAGVLLIDDGKPDETINNKGSSNIIRPLG